MSVNSNSINIQKKNNDNKRVLWDTSKNGDAFKDSDITLFRTIGAHSSATSKFIVSNSPSYFIFQAYNSNNVEDVVINNNVNNLSKTFSSNSETKTACYLYLSELDTVSFKIEFTSTGTTFSGGNMVFNNKFPNLKSIEAAVSLGSYRFGFLPNQNWDNLPSFSYFYGNHTDVLASCPTLRKGMIGSINQISLRTSYLSLRSLYTLMGTGTFELANFWNGNQLRNSLYIGGSASGVHVSIVYNGTALFPKHITQDNDYPVNYIMDVGTTNIGVAIPPDQLSQLIIDFANQVDTVTVDTKLIKLKGSPNTSYSDSTQPKYKTYSEALNRITNSVSSGGLGCKLTIVT